MNFDLAKLKDMNREAEIIQLDEKAERQEDDRTIEIAFASEFPVLREFEWGVGYEIIDLARMDMSRLEDKAALLAEHRTDSQIGVVESVSNDDDGMSRASVRFGRSLKAEEYFNDVIDGIRTKVSFGYEVTEVREDGELDGFPVYRVSTRPFEISMVSFPADPNVGVGRNDPSMTEINSEEKIMESQNTEAKTEATKDPVVDMESIRAKESARLQSEMRKILERGKQLNMVDAAIDASQRGLSVQEFETIALDLMNERSQQREVTSADLGITPKEMRSYSVLNIIRAAQEPHKAHEIMAFEREVSDAYAEKFGRSAEGCFVPHDVLLNRAMNTGVASEGGDLVGTDHLGNEIIMALHDRTVLSTLGVRNLNGLVGNIDIPKVTGIPNVQWIAEGASPTDSELTLSSVTMSPKTVAGATPFTRKLAIQSDPSVEALVRQEILTALAVGIDTGVLVGSAGSPTALIATSGVLTQAIASAGSPTWGEIVGFESQVATANALMGNPYYLTTSAVVGNLKTTSKDSGSGLFLMSDNNTVNGHPVLATNLLPTDTIIFGDFSQILVGYWGALDLVTDTSTLATSGGTVLRVFQDLDSAVRYPQAFCKNA